MIRTGNVHVVWNEISVLLQHSFTRQEVTLSQPVLVAATNLCFTMSPSESRDIIDYILAVFVMAERFWLVHRCVYYKYANFLPKPTNYLMLAKTF